MTTIHEINQALLVETPHGLGIAIFIIDYGLQLNTIWVIANKLDGQIRHYDSNQIKLSINQTIEFNIGK